VTRDRRVMFAEMNYFKTVEGILEHRYIMNWKEEQALTADVNLVLLRLSAVLLSHP
jgi:hypothetical protein